MVERRESLTISSKFNRSADGIVNHPWVVCAFLTILSGFAILGYTDPHRLTDLFAAEPEPVATESTASSKPPEVRAEPPKVEAVSLSRSDAVVVVESDAIFTQSGARALRRVVADLEALPHVKDVLWMDRVPILNIFGLPEPLFPKAQASPERFAAAREKALQHPLVGSQLLSEDGRTVLLLVNFEWLFVEKDEDCMDRLREVAEEAVAEFEDVQFSFLVTGRVPIRLTMMRTHEDNETKYQVIGYSMVLLMAVILFRGINAVLIVALAPSMGVFWTLGILRYFDFQENPFNDVVLPVLLSLVGLTDGVHLMVQIRRYRARGMTVRDAARSGLREVGLACALTSLTTAIGFGSLGLAHHETVRTFGWSCVMGVILTFVAVVTVIPLACSTWLGRRVDSGHEKGLIDKNLGRIGGIVEGVLAYPRFFSMAGIVITGVLCAISLTLRPDERRSSYLPSGAEAAIAMERMDKALGGLEFAEVQVTWNSDVEDGSPEVLETITEVDDLLRTEKLIGRPLSIRSLVDALPGEGKPAERISMLELLPPPLKRAFYTPEHRRATVNFRVQDLGIARYGPVFERMEAGLQDIAARHPNFSMHMTGSAVWRWQNLFQIVTDLAASLGSAAVVIFCVLALVYRSWRIGLISIIPNAFPLAVTGTFLVVTGHALELVSVCAFTVCLGIAVDDTIHFLTRFEEELERTGNQHEAIRRAFTSVGTALVMTTMVLCVGFSTVLFSDMRDQRIFAAMGGLTIASALFGDLVFLPAMLARFARSRPKAEIPVESTSGEPASDEIQWAETSP